MSGYFSSIIHHFRARPVFSIFACSSALGVGYAAPIYLDNYQRKKNASLNPTAFTPYTLVEKHAVSATSSIFILRPPPSSSATEELKQLWEQGNSLWSVQAKQPQLQIGREYTPLPPTETLQHKPTSETGDADLHLLIRREKNGEMTTYLHGLPLQSQVHLRGPYNDVRIPGHVDEVLFIAGGTGISPALQVAQIMQRRPNTRMTILWANRRREECEGAPLAVSPSTSGWLSSIKNSVGGGGGSSAAPKAAVDGSGGRVEKGLVVKVLDEMRTRTAPGSLVVDYFVDEDDSFIKHTHVRRILADSQVKPAPSPAPSSSGADDIGDKRPGAKLILVSGPKGFVDYWAGGKRLQDGKEVQGPLGGALAEMDLHGWKVWKL